METFKLLVLITCQNTGNNSSILLEPQGKRYDLYQASRLIFNETNSYSFFYINKETKVYS